MQLNHFLALALVSLTAAEVAAQETHTVAISIKETVGIRRYGYPVGVRVPFPKGALASTTNARVVFNGSEVPAQFTEEERWPDGSIQWLTIDLNATIGPKEIQTYQVEYGSQVRQTSAPRGLAVTEDADSVQVGNVRFGKLGAPLVMSVKYRGEDLGTAGTSFAISDAAGRLLNLKSGEPPKVEILKRGPLSVRLRYTGRLAVDANYSVPFVITVEMPNSKSWIKASAHVTDPGKKLREISYQTALSLGPLPWVWDFGTDRWTYGSLRNSSDSVVLTETVRASGLVDWQVRSGPKGKEQAYEMEDLQHGSRMIQWGHVQDSKEVIAFGVDRSPNAAGRYQFIADGDGSTSIRFAPAVPGTQHQLTVFQHFVWTPVQIGAATSPAAMLSPLVATCDPKQFVLSGVRASRK